MYRWDRGDGLDYDYPTARLRREDVPPVPRGPDGHDELHEVVRFAHTFNGYDWGGPPERLGEFTLATRRLWAEQGVLPDDVDALRALLFYWARADRHGGGWGPTEDDLAWLGALLGAIGTGLDADLGPR